MQIFSSRFRSFLACAISLFVNDLAASLDEPDRVYAATINGVRRLEDEP